jgi:hypothetical protein
VNACGPLPEHRTLSLLPAFRCSAGCGPGETSRLSLAQMLSAIDQAAGAGYGAVVFTGGEPTLAGRDLLAAMERAASHGLVVRLVTNAHWAVDEPAAGRRIAGFVRAGLDEIDFRTGDRHARFVPVERVLRAARAAVKAGLRIAVVVEAGRERKVTRQTVEAHPELQALRRDVPGASIEVYESPWTLLPPLALHVHEPGIVAGAANVNLRPGCAHTATVEVDGRLGAGCGLGMRLIPELQVQEEPLP